MRHGVSLQPAGLGDVPVVGADRYVVLEQASGLRAAATAVLALRFARGQHPVHVRRADGPELFAHFGTEFAVLSLVVRQPQLQHRYQALTAGLLSHPPDAPEHLHDLRTILGWAPLAHPRVTSPARAGAEQLDGVLAAVTELLTQLVDHARAALPPTVHIPLPQARQHLFPDFLTHGHQLGLPVSSFLSQRPFYPLPTFIPRVSKLTSQQVIQSSHGFCLDELIEPTNPRALFLVCVLQTNNWTS